MVVTSEVTAGAWFADLALSGRAEPMTLAYGKGDTEEAAIESARGRYFRGADWLGGRTASEATAALGAWTYATPLHHVRE